jgi:hypothetical protein
MSNFVRAVRAALVLAISLPLAPALAQQPAASPPPPALASGDAARDGNSISLQNLVAIRNLRCEQIRSGKSAAMRANIHRSEATHAQGPARLDAEQQLAAAEAESGAAFEQAGNLKRKLAEMSEAFLSAHRLLWYQTVDQAKKLGLEEQIKAALEIQAGSCEGT